MFAKRIQCLHPSATFALAANAKKLRDAGISVIDLGLGEPDFVTPRNIRDAAVSAIREGFTHYTETAGIGELREAIANKLLTDNAIPCTSSEVVVGVGSKQLLYHAFQIVCDEGDEVIVPTPTWSTYIEQMKLAGCTPVLVRLRPPFKLKADHVAQKITPKTKAIVLNSPSNPTGAMIDRAELVKIAELAVEMNIFVISDEIYEKIIYEGRHCSIASLGEDIRRLTITIGGFSKAYAMTGWRVGYAAASLEIIEQMIAFQSQTTSNTSSVGQKAALEALTGSQESVQSMIRKFSLRRTYCIDRLSQIKGISCTRPEGGFYVFINIRPLLGHTYTTSADVSTALLDTVGVSVIPGEAFLYPGYVRMSFSASMSDLKEAMMRIEQFTKAYA